MAEHPDQKKADAKRLQSTKDQENKLDDFGKHVVKPAVPEQKDESKDE